MRLGIQTEYAHGQVEQGSTPAPATTARPAWRPGERRRKDDPRLVAIGSVDEANAALGLVRLHSSGDLDALLARLQNDLFDLGADLATPGQVSWTPGTHRRAPR
ncbi:MAG: ATP:cob(I)alamin adenosyltransferase [Asticcacaulis sp.]